MKNYRFLFLLFITAMFAFAFSAGRLHVDTYNIYKPDSEVIWKINDKGYKGTIDIRSGAIHMNHGVLNGFNLDLNTTAINVTEPDKERKQEKIIKNLQEEDNFYSEIHQSIILKLSRASQQPPTEEGWKKFDVTCRMAVKGIYESVTFPLELKVDGNTIKARGHFTIKKEPYELDRDIYISFDLYGFS